MTKRRAVILAAEYNNIRKTLRKLQSDIDKASSKFCIQINGLVVDLDRLEKKESKKNVVQKERKI